MTQTLNRKAVEHAEKLIHEGKVVKDERDDWSEDAPGADDENAFIDKHGWSEFELWYLGVDKDVSEETKGRYTFPIGDFSKIHRCGVISAESRAAQYDHDSIKEACAKLLELIDGKD